MRILVGLSLALAACGGGGGHESYFPVAEGNTWTWSTATTGDAVNEGTLTAPAASPDRVDVTISGTLHLEQGDFSVETTGHLTLDRDGDDLRVSEIELRTAAHNDDIGVGRARAFEVRATTVCIDVRTWRSKPLPPRYRRALARQVSTRPALASVT